jgi:glycosyltransferase involved in cell wall biosynthesis
MGRSYPLLIRMKIAYIGIIGDLYYSLPLLRLLDEAYEVDFLFFGGKERFLGKEIFALSLEKSGLKHVRHLKGFYIAPKVECNVPLVKALLGGSYDIIIKDTLGRFALPISFIIAKLLRKKFILRIDIYRHPATLFHYFSKGALRFICRHADAVCAYGDHVKDFAVSLGAAREKIFVLPYAVDNALCSKEASRQEKEDLKKSLGLSDKKVILYAGRIVEEKGLQYLLEAYRQCTYTHKALVIIGDGGCKEGIKHLALQLKLENVIFLAHIPRQELYKYYAAADLFVLPSISTRWFSEAWGVVVNEAMNQGLPVIATDSVGAARAGLVRDGMNGFVVKEKNALELSRAISRLLDNEALRQKMSEASKAIIKEYTPHKMLEAFQHAIEYVRRK